MPARENPNINSKSDSESIQSYYEAILVEFYSLRKFNRDLCLELITTQYPPVRFHDFLKYLGVSVKLIPFTHQPPKGYTSQFLGCFYLLDAIIAEENEDTLYLDPDVICLKSILPIQQSTPTIKAFEMHVSEHTVISGLSIRESYNISSEILDYPPGISPNYKFFGGEFYFIPIKQRKECVLIIEKLYNESLRRFSCGYNYYPTEEHLLSAAFSLLECENANDIISRVWTAPSFRNVKGNEMEKILLHFPAEKEWGFKKMYKEISGMIDPLNELSELQFFIYVKNYFQLLKPSNVRYFLRVLNKVKEKFYFAFFSSSAE